GRGNGGGTDHPRAPGEEKPVPNSRADMPCETTEPDPGLREVAVESGGGYFELRATDELAHTFARVADELHRQYLLGFTPQNLDGKTHRLEVRPKDSSLIVRARRSYVAEAK